MSTTQTGIPIQDCLHCGYRHPVTRRHCPACGLATLFGHEGCTSDPEQLDMLRYLEEMTP